MDNKRLKRALGVAIPLFIIIIGISYTNYVKMHTFTLLDNGMLKREQIQAIKGSVKVTGTVDTDVVFTDVENGETFVLGYITPGAGDKIKLEQGKWYKVEGAGELTVRPVNVRIE